MAGVVVWPHRHLFLDLRGPGPTGVYRPRFSESGKLVARYSGRPSPYFSIYGLLAHMKSIGPSFYGERYFGSAWYSGRDEPLFLIYGPWRNGSLSVSVFGWQYIGRRGILATPAPYSSIYDILPPWLSIGPRFQESDTSVGAVFWANRALITYFMASWNIGAYHPRIPENGILVGAVFWPRHPLIFRFKGTGALGSTTPFPGSSILVCATFWPRPYFSMYAPGAQGLSGLFPESGI